MAALDPTAQPEFVGNAQEGSTPRATLKLIRQPYDPEGDSDDEDADHLDALLNGADSEDEDDSEDEEPNGGPSDPSKSKKARTEAAMESLKKALAEADDDGMELDKSAKNKGKAKVTDLDDISDSEGDSEDIEMEEFVLCTLDPNQVSGTGGC